MKKFFAFIISVLTITSVLSVGLCASADFNNEKDAVKGLSSEIYYMVSLDDETELFSKNAEKKVAPAAFAKIIGAMVAIEKWGNLEEEVKITDKSLGLMEYEYGIKTVSLKAGETYTKRQLIDAVLIYSANDAASVIAYELSGSAAAFVTEMNEFAAKIGCNNTKLVNFHGFDEKGQYTTAKDIATLIKYAENSPVFAEDFNADEMTLPATSQNEERTYTATNKMKNVAISDYYHSSVVGGKQTSTDEAGECIAVTTSQDGYSYLAVVLKGKLKDIDKDGVDENTAVTDAKQLINWIYENVRFKVIATVNQTISVVKVVAGRNSDTLRLVPEKETSALVPAKASSSSVLITPIEDTLPDKLVAPIKAGDVICQAKVYYAEQEITTINLVAANDVKLSLFRLAMNGLANVLSSTLFIILEVVALIGVVLYVAFIIMNKTKKKPNLKVVKGTGKKVQNKNRKTVKK